MMENNLENKAKFFAQYYGQEILVVPDDDIKSPATVGYLPIEDLDYLELKPLSSITDEDAIEVALLCGGANSLSHGKELLAGTFGKHFKNRYSCRPPEGYASDIIDFVRSKGYATPYMDLTVAKLVEYGWIKLTQ